LRQALGGRKSLGSAKLAWFLEKILNHGIGMKTKTNLIFFFFIITITNVAHSATWKKITSGTPNVQVCPTGYIFVPALSGYTTRDFCVAKYEMKNDGYGAAVSKMAGVPWVSINRATARAACKTLGAGYDMISNDQWQTIARNIAGTASNWSGGALASGELNRGHSDNSPANVLAAADDTDPCNGTGATCLPTSWDSQRRTHTLSNGNVIWDFAGNVSEWITNDSNISNGSDDYISAMSGGDIRQTRYGVASGNICPSPSASPYCGLGYGWFNYGAGAVLRGGNYGTGTYAGERAGVFATGLGYAPTATDTFFGFRCVFVP